MTTPMASEANLMNGIREFGQVTNTYGGYLQSAGATPYNLTLPFMPDVVKWWNYTQYSVTNTSNISGVWFRDMAAGKGLVVNRANTVITVVNSATITTGVTDASTTGGFINQHLVISDISAGVVTTTAAHGLVDGDRVTLTKIIGTVAAQLNNNTYVVVVQSSTTFKLYDVYGVAITQSGTWTSSGQVTKVGPELGIESLPASYILTLGVAVMGSDNDIIYFEAMKYNNYVNIGDVA